ncbi:histidine kinase [Maricaulis sp. MIT060901]|uniref:histidine kinase n=1 Tax=Maricaulis sp. MIT060901 TaxID=3096993 RepID=UPI00399B2C77
MAALILWLDDSDRTFRAPDQLLDEIVLFGSALGLLILVPAIFFFRLKLQSSWAWLAGLVVAITASMVPIGGLEQDARALLAMSLFLAVMAVMARTATSWERWSHLAAALMLTGAVVIRPDLLRFFLAALVVLMGASLLAEVLAREIIANRNLARMARLQLALVKRNIQPHFIMNSLTVANELQQTDSQAASRFVDAMAGEFRALANMVDQDTTTVLEEIELCRNHLTMMGLRLGREFSLEFTSDQSDAPFPPGVLHTLVENAISHNRYRQEAVTFSLTGQSVGGARVFELRVPRADRAGETSMGTGSGTAYIEARLEEFAPGDWHFSSQADARDWVSRITLPEVST